ncbi:MAG TPA: N utilization substance protein B, partial [Lysinibacillus sp.]|nr:N utilization substance protein B [Lysinibacillus sp.]
MKRHEAREKALQVLFQLDNTDLTVEEAMGHIKGQPTNAFYEKIVT